VPSFSGRPSERELERFCCLNAAPSCTAPLFSPIRRPRTHPFLQRTKRRLSTVPPGRTTRHVPSTPSRCGPSITRRIASDGLQRDDLDAEARTRRTSQQLTAQLACRPASSVFAVACLSSSTSQLVVRCAVKCGVACVVACGEDRGLAARVAVKQLKNGTEGGSTSASCLADDE
jgi:hypothetical protein